MEDGPSRVTLITLQLAEGTNASTSAEKETFGGAAPAGSKVWKTYSLLEPGAYGKFCVRWPYQEYNETLEICCKFREDVPLNFVASSGANFVVVLIRKLGSKVGTVFRTKSPVEKMVY